MIYFFGGGHHTVFQSTHLREVRLPSIQRNPLRSGFQSTHLREVRLAMSILCLLLLEFQSTHLREVRPKEIDWGEPVGRISIHAPT